MMTKVLKFRPRANEIFRLQTYIVQLEDMIEGCIRVTDAMNYAEHGEKLLLEVRKRVEARKKAAYIASLDTGKDRRINDSSI